MTSYFFILTNQKSKSLCLSSYQKMLFLILSLKYTCNDLWKICVYLANVGGSPLCGVLPACVTVAPCDITDVAGPCLLTGIWDEGILCLCDFGLPGAPPLGTLVLEEGTGTLLCWIWATPTGLVFGLTFSLISYVRKQSACLKQNLYQGSLHKILNGIWKFVHTRKKKSNAGMNGPWSRKDRF